MRNRITCMLTTAGSSSYRPLTTDDDDVDADEQSGDDEVCAPRMHLRTDSLIPAVPDSLTGGGGGNVSSCASLADRSMSIGSSIVNVMQQQHDTTATCMLL